MGFNKLVVFADFDVGVLGYYELACCWVTFIVVFRGLLSFWYSAMMVFRLFFCGGVIALWFRFELAFTFLCVYLELLLASCYAQGVQSGWVGWCLVLC